MENPTDETRLKELIKTAIVEVMEEQGFVKPRSSKPIGSASLNPMAKTIAIWAALLITAVLLYQVLVARP